MALPVLPNTDNFLGVALVINRSRDGPRLVFHYPPRLLPAQRAKGNAPGGDDVDDDDDTLLGRPPREARVGTGASSALLAAELAQWNHDDHFVTESGTQIVPWEHVAGFPTKDLENMLTPARAYHKKLFQVSLDPIYCVSYPIYVPENGVWRKKKSKKPQPQPQQQQQQRQQQRDSGAAAKKEDDDPATTDAGGSARSGGEKIEVRDMLKPQGGKVPEETEDKKSNMTMFNLVFFLSPKKHEVKPLVDIMFAHIIKKINKAYKYCQQRSDFVWKESKRILALKDKGRESSRPPLLLPPDMPMATSSCTDARDREEDEPAVGRDTVKLVAGSIHARPLRGCLPEQDRRPAAGHSRGPRNPLGSDPSPIPRLRPATGRRRRPPRPLADYGELTDGRRGR